MDKLTNDVLDRILNDINSLPETQMPNKRVTTFEGTVETCCHRVAFRYWDFRAVLTDELQQRLTEDAEERAKQCIIEGCHSGDLNCLYITPTGRELEIRGWWEIERD